jgi:hypothetical protein
LEHAGIFHLFYQYNPEAPTWDRPHWGHVASTDLVHWQQLPTALAPDTEFDRDGVFSGSATILNNGTPVIMYTGEICSAWLEGGGELGRGGGAGGVDVFESECDGSAIDGAGRITTAMWW